VNLWKTIERLVDDAANPAAIQAHGLQLFAARRWRAVGRAVPPAWIEAERASAIATLGVPSLLARVRASLPGPILLLKGAEVATRYPDPALRQMGDLDLLVPDAPAAARALRDAGFAPAVGEAESARPQHLPPLSWPRSPLPIELHHAPPVPPWSSPPPVAALVAASVQSTVCVEGIRTPDPASHAVLLAAHAWLHFGPRPRVRDLVDVAVMAEELDREQLQELAGVWGLARVWTVTSEAIGALSDRRGTDLEAPSLAGEHLSRWAGGLWAPTWRAVPRALTQTVGQDLRPWPDEGWPTRLRRLGHAVPHAFSSNADYRRARR
jgi:hypothetical protein